MDLFIKLAYLLRYFIEVLDVLVRILPRPRQKSDYLCFIYTSPNPEVSAPLYFRLIP